MEGTTHLVLAIVPLEFFHRTHKHTAAHPWGCLDTMMHNAVRPFKSVGWLSRSDQNQHRMKPNRTTA